MVADNAQDQRSDKSVIFGPAAHKVDGELSVSKPANDRRTKIVASVKVVDDRRIDFAIIAAERGIAEIFVPQFQTASEEAYHEFVPNDMRLRFHDITLIGADGDDRRVRKHHQQKDRREPDQ